MAQFQCTGKFLVWAVLPLAAKEQPLKALFVSPSAAHHLHFIEAVCSPNLEFSGGCVNRKVSTFPPIFSKIGDFLQAVLSHPKSASWSMRRKSKIVTCL
jgi:hypothetical protein